MQRKRKKTSDYKEVLRYAKRFRTRYKDLDVHLEQLNAMIGMQSLKKAVLAQIKFLLANGKTDDHYLHTLILGPPGCGKTTIAKILHSIWKSLDLFDVGAFRILHRSDFVGNFMGQTSNKTKKTLKKHKGGCLFIDEFYSMVYGDNDEYGRESLDELNAFMSEQKDTIVIAAGYERKIKSSVLAAQPGLARRFAWVFTIEPYSAEELYHIFKSQLKSHGWSLTDRKGTLDLFVKHHRKFKHAGGDTENIAFKAKIAYSRRHWKTPGTKKLRLADVREAMDAHFTDESEVPLNMYL